MSQTVHPAVVLERVSKAFFGVRVLKEVSLSIGAGRILGLVGENGAGKSTLMNLLGGNLQPDSGTIQVQGAAFTPANPAEARAAGVALVHQELNLFPNLSVAENLFLTEFPRLGGTGGSGIPIIDRRALLSQARALLQTVGLSVDPSLPLEHLAAGERQLVEIARAIGGNARILLLDEPTTSLSARECERLFSLLRSLQERGLALVYISHTLADVLRLCDDLVVLRDGEIVGGGLAAEFGQERLVSLMVGRQLDQLYPSRSPRPGEPGVGTAGGGTPSPLLQVRGLSHPGIVRDVSFDLHAGEVLGVAGLMGAGRSELARILFGLDPCELGEVKLEGTLLKGGPRERIRRGMAFLTEDRREEGLCQEATIAENMTHAMLHAHATALFGWLRLDAMVRAVAGMRSRVRLTPGARDGQPVRTLSGGNQQKVVLGKWLLAAPRVLLLDEPTRGIDVGARLEIYQLVHQLADEGAGVLIISSEIEELTGICDRILVMRQGAIAAEFSRGAFDREQILQAALPVTKS